MALRLSEYVLAGELFNTQKNSVHGYLWLRDSDRPILFQLTGNCLPDLAGHHLRFEARPNPMTGTGALTEEEVSERRIAWMQIGVVGEMTALRQVRSSDCPIDEFLRRSSLGEQPPTEWKRSLYLEWYSQNGRVVVELVDPVIEIDPEENSSSVSGFFASSPFELEEASLDDDVDADGSALLYRGADREYAVEDPDSELDDEPFDDLGMNETSLGIEEADDELEDDPYGLFPKDLDLSLETSASDRPWSDGSDAELLALWGGWDIVDDQSEHVPICTLFDPPLKVPPSESLDEEQVAQGLTAILMQLALHNISLHMCEHFTPRAAYELLVNEILRHEEVHPELAGSDMTQNFDTSVACTECDRLRSERESRSDDSPGNFDSDVPF